MEQDDASEAPENCDEKEEPWRLELEMQAREERAPRRKSKLQ